jgi:hypothetical protein
MTAEAEMRAVILHAAEKLDAAKATRSTGYNDPLPATVMVAIGYAEGILRLLASYLVIEPPKSNGHRKGQRSPDWPRDEHGRYLKAGAP